MAIALDTMATLTDEIIDLNDRLMGSFFTKARNRFAKDFAESGKAINDKVRLFDQIGTALIDARTKGTNPFAAIEYVGLEIIGSLCLALLRSGRHCHR